MKSGGIVPSGGKLLDTKKSIRLRMPFWYNNPMIASEPIKKTKTNLWFNLEREFQYKIMSDFFMAMNYKAHPIKRILKKANEFI